MSWKWRSVDGKPAAEFAAWAAPRPPEAGAEPRTARVERRAAPDGSEAALKRPAGPGLGRRLRGSLRGSWLVGQPAVAAECRALARMRELGVPAVEPLGWGARRDGFGFVRDSLLITRWWPHPDLERLLRERGPPPPGAWMALGVAAAVMHARGVLHGRLHPSHVLLGAAADGRWRARWLGASRARFRGRALRTEEAERDLDPLRATLDAAPPEARAAFEEGYCSPSFWSPSASAGSTSSASPTTP